MMFAAIRLLFGGLFIINAIFAYQAKHIEPVFLTTLWYQVKLVPLMLAANLMIGFGVKKAYDVLQQLTLSLTLSKAIEISVCVLLGWIFLKEVPNWRTAVGMAMIVGGFFVMKIKGS
ncbi:hypothetical protein NSQ26_04950 [Bacillus sp. FSL W7-1360]